ncbi:tRNA-uridine aminocarboxypropyltransferase [Marinobacter sp. V034]|uniref:tRNA-uridine aminocarboxypropyltransferase n=1 Tax=Marinobacter sp. V034 TaxID=3459610 RepID=UPI0040450700
MRQAPCPRCGVHPNICVCDACQPISGAPPLWVLQHPSEVAQNKGTLRIATACLPDLRVLVGETPADFEPLAIRSQQIPMGLIYPTTASAALESAPVAQVREWIILDGTWRKASRIFLSNPWLNALPQFHFNAAPPSRYRIRKASRDDSVSTVEAIAHLLSQVAPGCDYDPLYAALDTLVKRQLAQMPPKVRQRYD